MQRGTGWLVAPPFLCQQCCMQGYGRLMVILARNPYMRIASYFKRWIAPTRFFGDWSMFPIWLRHLQNVSRFTDGFKACRGRGELNSDDVLHTRSVKEMLDDDRVAKDLEQLQQSLCQSFSFCRSFPPFPSSGFHHSNVFRAPEAKNLVKDRMRWRKMWRGLKPLMLERYGWDFEHLGYSTEPWAEDGWTQKDPWDLMPRETALTRAALRKDGELRHVFRVCKFTDIRVPVCNGPETTPAFAQSSLDVMYSRQLLKDSQIRWASPACRPDLGETSLALVDAQEESVEALRWVLQGRDLAEGRGGGQINRPGVYRTICLEVNLRSKLCVCALQHARYLSDMEGGELSRKMIRKVLERRKHGPTKVGTDSTVRNMDHSSEASVTNLESLVSMVQEICSAQAAKAKEMETLRQNWAKQSRETRTGPFDEDAFNQLAEQCEDVRLMRKLQELRDEWQTLESLLDGLYGWLASPTSLLYDAALLRRVHQYMDRVLKLLVDAVKRNGCSIIHASYSKAAGAAPVNATKADGNLPTCYYLATSGTKTYEGEYQWVIELEKGWSAWLPGNEPFQGSTAKPMRYTLGRYDFEVHFESESHGTQTNLTTGKVRRIQRLQKGEAFPAWEGTGVRRRPASAAAGAPAKNATAAPADSAAKAAQSNRTARRSGYPWPQPQGPTQVTKSQPGRPQVSQVIMETFKVRIPDVVNFYQALLQSMNAIKALQPLNLKEEEAQAAMYYGMIWLDPSDWAGIPIEIDTGEISWEADPSVSRNWKLAEYLPPAVQGDIEFFASNLLYEPQKWLGQRFGLYEEAKENPERAPMGAMEVDEGQEKEEMNRGRGDAGGRRHATGGDCRECREAGPACG
ncbi:unnamed protein product [Durusdinium trenchii]|uniref:DNA polymerase epsilon catalytic subunit n=1 Tax=Durusdinium trenchii TaxID=1381693 RepID=A0ABP0RT36_9DINO